METGWHVARRLSNLRWGGIGRDSPETFRNTMKTTKKQTQCRRLLDVDYIRQRLSYDPETGIFRWKTYPKAKKMVGQIAGHVRKTGQIVILLNNKGYLAHRIAWAYVTGKNPQNQIDHINCDPSDNRFENLRECTALENCRNKRIQKNNTSEVKGITRFRNKWSARVGVDGKKVFLGYFDSIQSAELAVKLGRISLHGEFAKHK